MKRLLLVSVILSFLSTPALANKTHVSEARDCKQDKVLTYHLDEMQKLIDQLRQDALVSERKRIFRKSA